MDALSVDDVSTNYFSDRILSVPALLELFPKSSVTVSVDRKNGLSKLVPLLNGEFLH